MLKKIKLGLSKRKKENSSESVRGSDPLLKVKTLLLVAVVGMIFNQFVLGTVSGVQVSGGTIQLGADFQVGPKMTLVPTLLASGEQPALQGYKTRFKPWPTVSEIEFRSATGDIGQDLLNNLIPTGTPWYGNDAGVSFDDPVNALNKWGTYRSLQLTSEQNARWQGIVGRFTCDYCCGSPKNPTIITNCGCAHSRAWQGIAKFLIKNYGDQYTDEEIFGEMGRWKALWYPGPTIQRIAAEMGQV